MEVLMYFVEILNVGFVEFVRPKIVNDVIFSEEMLPKMWFGRNVEEIVTRQLKSNCGSAVFSIQFCPSCVDKRKRKDKASGSNLSC